MSISKKAKKDECVFYLDTNFIIDCTEGRQKDSVLLMEKIREKGWRCLSSTFTLMEMADVEKDKIYVQKKLQKRWTINQILRERYKKDLNADDFADIQNTIENKVSLAYSFIDFVAIAPQAWQAALDITVHSNLSAADALHLATAWNGKCGVVLTSDEQFIKAGRDAIANIEPLKNLEIMRPSEFLKKVK